MRPTDALDHLIGQGLFLGHRRPVGSLVANTSPEVQEALQELRSEDIRDVRPPPEAVYPRRSR